MGSAVERAAANLRHAVGVLRGGVGLWWRSFRVHRGFQNAGAISYFAILSSIPFLVLLLAAFGFVVHLLGPRYGSEEHVIGLLVRTVHDMAPFVASDVETRLRSIVQAREAIGIVGGVFLFLGSSMVFGAAESALQDIFGSRRTHLLVSRLFFFLFFAGMAVLLVGLHILVVIVGSWTHALDEDTLLGIIGRYPPLDWLFSFVVLGGGFAVVVAYFARRRIRPFALLAGASLFYALFALSRWAFSWYIESFARFDIAYGSLATLVTGFVWVYYGSLVFLLSVEFLRILDERARRRSPRVDDSRPATDPAAE